MGFIQATLKFVVSIVFVTGAILIRTYLHILDYAHCATSSEATEGNRLKQISIIVECVLKAVQKILVYQAIFWIGLNVDSIFGWAFPVPLGIIGVCACILIPRLLFSIMLVASSHDYNRHREKSIKRKVNISTKLATMYHKWISTLFSVLNVQETTTVTVLERIEYVFWQLLGHNYAESVIAIYSETESALTFLTVLYLHWTTLHSVNTYFIFQFYQQLITRTLMIEKCHLSFIGIRKFRTKARTPEYRKLNPQQLVPLLDDNGFLLGESRAIMRYLVNKYAPDSSLYPSDPATRAVIDRLLDFDCGTFGAIALQLLKSKFYDGREPTPDQIFVLKEALSIFEEMIGRNEDFVYLAGNQVTLADLSIVATVHVLFILGIDLAEYPRLKAWQTTMEKLPYYEELNTIPCQIAVKELGTE